MDGKFGEPQGVDAAQDPLEQAPVSAPRERFRRGHLPIYLILLFGVVIAVMPFFWMISTSLMTYGETIVRRVLPSTPHFGNYVEAWMGGNFGRYLSNSVLITATTVSGQIVTSVLAAYAFARIRFFGRDVIFIGLLATMMIPQSILVIPNYMMIRGDVLPLPGGSWTNSLQGLTVPFIAHAFSIFLLRQFFAQIPWDLWDAARIDGSGHLRFLVQIVMPMSKAPIMTVGLFAFISAWNEFMWPLLVTTRDEWRPLSVGLWNFITEAGPETHLLMAGSVITILPVVVLYFFTQKQFTNALAGSSTKG